MCADKDFSGDRQGTLVHLLKIKEETRFRIFQPAIGPFLENELCTSETKIKPTLQAGSVRA